MAAPAYQAVSSKAYGSTANTEVAKPTGVVSGDLMLTRIILGAEPVPTLTPPEGWTLMPVGTWPTSVTGGGFNVKMWIYYKVAGGSEPTTYKWTHTTASSAAAVIRITGAGASPKFKAANKTGSGTTYTFASVTTESSEALIAIFGHDWGGAAVNLTPPTGTTPTFTERLDITLDYVATGTFTGPGTMAEKTMTNNSGGAFPWATGTIAIEPPASEGTKGEATVAKVLAIGAAAATKRLAAASIGKDLMIGNTPAGRRAQLAAAAIDRAVGLVPAPVRLQAAAAGVLRAVALVPLGGQRGNAAVAVLIDRAVEAASKRAQNAAVGPLKGVGTVPGTQRRQGASVAQARSQSPAPTPKRLVGAATAVLRAFGGSPTTKRSALATSAVRVISAPIPLTRRVAHSAAGELAFRALSPVSNVLQPIPDLILPLTAFFARATNAAIFQKSSNVATITADVNSAVFAESTNSATIEPHSTAADIESDTSDATIGS